VDVATAAKLSAAYNRARYSPVSEDDPQLREAVEALERVAAGVTAMPARSRTQLARSLSERLISTSVEPMLERETDALDACMTPVPATRANRLLQRNAPTPQLTTPGKTRERSERPSRSFAKDDLLAAFAPSFLRRIAMLPRVSLVFAALAAVATFGGGYFLHSLAPSRPAMSEKRPEMSDAPLGGRNLNAPAATNFVLDAKLLLDGVRSRAVEETRARQYGKARLGLELVLAYSPDDPYVLNDLALLYLTPSQDGTADPKRALQLIERALQLTREPAILETAAEAQFQCGNLHDAMNLEEESMANAFEPDDENDEFHAHRINQLQKFQGAAQFRTADRLPATSNENASPDSGSVKRVDPAAGAGHSKAPANPQDPHALAIANPRIAARVADFLTGCGFLNSGQPRKYPPTGSRPCKTGRFSRESGT
jgi:hypothetical protein